MAGWALNVIAIGGGLGAAIVAVAVLSVRAAKARRGLAEARSDIASLRARLDERTASANRHETLLAAISEASPTSIVLFTDGGEIALANAAARALLFEGRQVEGQNFLAMLERAPEPLRRALLGEGEDLFSVDDADGVSETFHLSKQHLVWDGKPHTLMAVRPVGTAIAREENASLKKVIRTIGHEIGNSLGPVSSLIGSARVLLARPDERARLGEILDIIGERSRHLQTFLEGYAKLARLPQPRPEPAPWGPPLDAVRALWPKATIADAPARPGYFDTAQIQQVLINLVKNACEAGGPQEEVRVAVEEPPEGGNRLLVLDRGTGMSDEVLRSAFLPFFTTKPGGGGLGLALCREIVGLHRGVIRLVRREGGGTAVSVWLPARDGRSGASLAGSRIRLDLTRS